MTSTQDRLKKEVAEAALDLVAGEFRTDVPIGVGTGSTVDFFIDALASHRTRFGGAVASSERSADRLRRHGVKIIELDEVKSLPIYVDGADELTPGLAMLKGGGGALTREKIVAAVAERFVCIVDETKLVLRLGHFPLPVEVIPMARVHVTRRLLELSDARAEIRVRSTQDGKPFITDNGNLILDVLGLEIDDPSDLERQIDTIVGVVSNGLFSCRGADVALLASSSGVRLLSQSD